MHRGPAAESAGRLEWAGDEDDGYLGRGLVEGKYPIAYTVMPVVFRGCEHFEAKIITDPNADFALSVKKLADRYGAALTRDQKGQRRTIAPVPTADEAKELCEIAYGNRGGAAMWIVEQRAPFGDWFTGRPCMTRRPPSTMPACTRTIIRNCAFGIAAQMKMANHSLTANQ